MNKKASPVRQSDLCSRIVGAVADFFCARSDVRPRSISLLRLAALGSPEKTIQGELLFHLRAKGFYAVSECGLRLSSGRRNVDIVVFDRAWRPALLIEIKHYSANQGGQGTLFRRLREDFDRERPRDHAAQRLPLLQVGLFTAVTFISSAVKLPASKINGGQQFYRFLHTYCKAPTHSTRRELAEHKGPGFRRRGVKVQREEFVVSPRDEKFTLPLGIGGDSSAVGGRVGAWLILSTRAS